MRCLRLKSRELPVDVHVNVRPSKIFSCACAARSGVECSIPEPSGLIARLCTTGDFKANVLLDLRQVYGGA